MELIKNTPSFIKALAGGLVVSFLGALPPGTMTIAATFITAKQGVAAAWSYSLGSMIAELLVVWLILNTMAWLGKWHRLFFILEIFTAIILLAMAAACFYASQHTASASNHEWHYTLNPFATGFLLSILNPVHIPFWMGWSVVLMNKSFFQPVAKQYYSYLGGIGIGSLLGFAVYIYGGSYLLDTFSKHQNIIELLAGVVLSVIFFMQVKKMMLIPAAKRYNPLRPLKEEL